MGKVLQSTKEHNKRLDGEPISVEKFFKFIRRDRGKTRTEKTETKTKSA